MITTANTHLIRVYRRSQYGNLRTFAADPDTARTLSKLTGIKTLLEPHIEALKELGFTFEVVIDPEQAGRI